MLRPVRGTKPTLGTDCFVAPGAEVVGDVRMGRDCSIWFNVTLRGDVMPIVIGDESNIQDNSVVHGTFGKHGAVLGQRVTVGHSCVLHGCSIGDEVLIGMGSIIMDRAQIPSGSIVGAGSLVTEGATFPPGHLILGRPARAVRALNENEIAFLKKSANNYLEYKRWYTEPNTKPDAEPESNQE